MEILRYYTREDLIKEAEKENIDTTIEDVDGIFDAYLSLKSRLLEAVTGDEHTGGIYRLRGTIVWKIVTPLRAVVHHFRFSRQVFSAGGFRALKNRYRDFFNPKIIGIKIRNKIINSSTVRSKKGEEFLKSVLPNEEEKRLQRETKFEKNVKISVLVPLYNTPIKFLKDMIDSVVAQTYENWELCLCDASDDAHGEVGDVVREYIKNDKRIVYKKLTENRGISENTNECIDISSGDYISLFDHDDILHPSALFEVAKKINEEDADFIYTDEATFDGDSLKTLIAYHYKPDFAPDNLKGVNYICHLTTFSRELMEKAGRFRPEYNGSQDHDIILRLTSKAKHVSHVQKILYFWRSHSGSTAKDIGTKMYAIEAGLKAVSESERERGYNAKSYCTQICLTHYRLEYDLNDRPLVSIVVFDGDEEEQKYTLCAIARKCSYENIEVIVSGASAEKMDETVRAAANGKYVIFIGAGSAPVNKNFVEEFLMYAQREDTGIVSGRVLNNKKRIIHADKAFGKDVDGLFVETYPDAGVMDTGFMGRMYYAHNTSASSIQFMMIKKDLYLEVGGFETEYTDDGYEYDYAFKVRDKQKLVVVNPYVMAIRRDNKNTRLSGEAEKLLREKHADEIAAGDPYYNRNLSFEKLWERKDA
ncbi:MAG: glycosyltransferase [Lachnospiraceae bacterium]|nr:glycosyltransferase [Lachnospiraceae bacterium]